jgi:hypothetical protein
MVGRAQLSFYNMIQSALTIFFAKKMQAKHKNNLNWLEMKTLM